MLHLKIEIIFPALTSLKIHAASKLLESGSVFKQVEDALLFSKQREGSNNLVESGQKNTSDGSVFTEEWMSESQRHKRRLVQTNERMND